MFLLVCLFVAAAVGAGLVIALRPPRVQLTFKRVPPTIGSAASFQPPRYIGLPRAAASTGDFEQSKPPVAADGRHFLQPGDPLPIGGLSPLDIFERRSPAVSERFQVTNDEFTADDIRALVEADDADFVYGKRLANLDSSGIPRWHHVAVFDDDATLQLLRVHPCMTIAEKFRAWVALRTMTQDEVDALLNDLRADYAAARRLPPRCRAELRAVERQIADDWSHLQAVCRHHYSQPLPVVVRPATRSALVVEPAASAIVVGPTSVQPIVVRSAPAITVRPSKIKPMLIVPAPATRVEPPPRPAWDELGWVRRDEKGIETYIGLYRVVNRRSGEQRQFHGRISLERGVPVALIADPPAQIKKHPQGRCFMLLKAPWFRLNWVRPAGNVDGAILYVEKILDEAINQY